MLSRIRETLLVIAISSSVFCLACLSNAGTSSLVVGFDLLLKPSILLIFLFVFYILNKKTLALITFSLFLAFLGACLYLSVAELMFLKNAIDSNSTDDLLKTPSVEDRLYEGSGTSYFLGEDCSRPKYLKLWATD